MTPATFWFINHYASTPDQPSTSAFFFGRELARRGHRVVFFASASNYYFQQRTKGKAWSLCHREEVDGVVFYWLATTRISSRPVARMFNMLSFALVAFLVGLTRRQGPDYVIGTCPHPFAGATAWLLSVLRRAVFIYEIRDIWPESLERYSSGFAWKIAIAFFERLQRFLYRRARLIISVLPRIDQYFADAGITVRGIAHVPNCIELTAAGSGDGIAHDPDEVFRFYYVGGFSKYQGLDVLVEAALRLAKDPGARRFELHLVGEGSERAAIEKLVRSRHASNVFLHPPVPRHDVQKVLADSDCNLFHLLDIGEALRYGISPNKLIEYLLSGKPLIYAIPFEWQLLTEAHIGYPARCGDHDSMSEAMRAMLDTRLEEREEMGRKARELCTNFDVRTIVDRFLKALP